jgi:PAS domain S-box-containing protein
VIRNTGLEPGQPSAAWTQLPLARTQAALAQSEQQWRLMADATPQILWVSDAAGRVEFFNGQWSDYTGAPYEPTTAAEVAAAFLHPDDAAATMEAFDTARRSGTVFRVEHRIRSASGEYRWFLARANPYRDPAGGEIVRWFGASVDIHDRRTVEAALRQSEEHFRAVADLVPDLLWSNGPDGHIDWYNRRWSEYTGQTRDEALGAGWMAIIHPDDLPKTLTRWHQALEARQPYLTEHRVRRHDGQYRWHLVRAEPLGDRDGQVLRWFGSATDIHDQHTMRDSLAQQVRQRTAELETLAAREQAIMASAGVAIIATDLDGRITSFNPAAEMMLRRAAAKAVGSFITDFCEPHELTFKAQFFSPEVRAHAQRMPKPLVEGLLPERARPGEGPRNEWVYMRDDGTSFPGLLNLNVLRDERGQVIGFLAVITDLSERKKMEEQLRQRAAELEVLTARERAVFASAASAIIACDLAGRITVFNPAAEKMLRIPASQALGRKVLDFYDHEELRQRAHLFPQEVLEAALQLPLGMGDVAHQALSTARLEESFQDSSQQSEWTYVRADGTRFTGLLSVSVLRNQHGTAIGLLAVITDLTERKALEGQLRKRTVQAEAATAAKSAFLAHMSHEFRTPLNAVIGLSQLLAQRLLPEDVSRFISHIHQAGEQLLALTNDVLDLSRIEAGEMQLEHLAFELAPLLEAVRALVQPQADAKAVRVQLEAPADLPAQLVGDPLRIKQVLLNLLSNAVKFTPAGSVALRVKEMQRAQQTVTLRFDVLDTGIGIPHEQQARIFEPFTQVDSSTTRRFGGTGLGLSIVRRLVEMMHGRLELKSQPGQGSTFSVTLTMEAPTGVD